ncbi:MAG: TlyA family RNA methyltransferase [Spirochaetaceae bacterium]
MAKKQRALLDRMADVYPEAERERLMAAVVCGDIRVNGEKCRNPKARVPADAVIEWVPRRPVGRGYDKLGTAIDAFAVDCRDKIIIDAGSSTGGFTQRLLAEDARRVYAVDVGNNQLAWQIRDDTRVVVMERTNILHLSRHDFPEPPDFSVCDLSFRSLRHAAAHIAGLTAQRRVIALAKPQFEGASGDTFDGVVDDADGKTLIDALVSHLEEEGLTCRGRVPSALRGRKGNLEYFLDLVKTGREA